MFQLPLLSLLLASAAAVVLTPTEIMMRDDEVGGYYFVIETDQDPGDLVAVANSQTVSLLGTILVFEPSAVSATHNGTGYISAYCVLSYLDTTSTAQLSTRAAVYADAADLTEEEAQINTYEVIYDVGREPGLAVPSMTDSPVFTFNPASRVSSAELVHPNTATAQLLQIPVWTAPWDDTGDVTPIILIMASPNEPLTTPYGNVVFCYPNMTLTLVSGSTTASPSTVSTTYQVTEPETPEATKNVKDSTTRVLIVTLSLFGGMMLIIGVYALYVNSVRAHAGRYVPLSS